MLKIEKYARHDIITIRLIGRVRAELIELDLDGVTSLDVEAVRFLTEIEGAGIALRHCAPFILEWMNKEANCDDVGVFE